MYTLNCNGQLLPIRSALVMGIINATPDSFFAGSRQRSVDAMLKEAERMLSAGASILDVGGQSTRPGSERVDASKELARVIDGIAAIHERFPEAILSVDTFYAAVAEEAVAAGVSLINDISAGAIDPLLVPLVARMKLPYVLMHMQGEPKTMATDPHYDAITTEVLDFFINKIAELRAMGIQDIIVDPGFGFGKTIQHNFRLLRDLSVFRILGCPVMAGLSRKSTIYKTLGISADDALNGTTVMNTMALMNGASILRVHDVKEAMEAVRLVEACQLAQ